MFVRYKNSSILFGCGRQANIVKLPIALGFALHSSLVLKEDNTLEKDSLIRQYSSGIFLLSLSRC